MILPKDVDSKFRFITVAAQRAKQLQNGAKPRVEARSRKPTRVAIEEVIAGDRSPGRSARTKAPSGEAAGGRSSAGAGRRPRRHGLHRGLQGLRGAARAAEARRGRPRGDDRGRHALRDPHDVRGPLAPPGLRRPVGAGRARATSGTSRLADAADLLLVAPATANILGKFARGHRRRRAHHPLHRDHGARCSWPPP